MTEGARVILFSTDPRADLDFARDLRALWRCGRPQARAEP